MATAAPPIQSSQPSSLLRVLYTIQGEEENDSDDSASSSSASFPNCFLMDRPPSGLLKAHDVLARFPPAAAAAEALGETRGWQLVALVPPPSPIASTPTPAWRRMDLSHPAALVPIVEGPHGAATVWLEAIPLTRPPLASREAIQAHLRLQQRPSSQQQHESTGGRGRDVSLGGAGGGGSYNSSGAGYYHPSPSSSVAARGSRGGSPKEEAGSSSSSGGNRGGRAPSFGGLGAAAEGGTGAAVVGERGKAFLSVLGKAAGKLGDAVGAAVVSAAAAAAAAGAAVGGEVLVVGDRRVRVLREVAEGGYSKVFLVRSEEGGEGGGGGGSASSTLAMKQVLCFHKEAAADAANEGRMLKSLRHPNIIELVASSSQATQRGGQSCREFLFLFPYYPRGTLWDAVAKATAQNAAPGSPAWPFKEKELLALFLGTCEGLQHVHAQGLAHWDIKPHNVLLASASSADDADADKTPLKPVLMDFGSACPAVKEIKDRRAAMLLEEEAAAKCSPAYRAPELTQVEPQVPIDQRVDVWAMGCLLFAAAYGRSPFESPVEGVLKLGILSGRFHFPQNVPGYSPAFQQLIKRCLVPEPANRPFLPEVMAAARALV